MVVSWENEGSVSGDFSSMAEAQRTQEIEGRPLEPEVLFKRLLPNSFSPSSLGGSFVYVDGEPD